MRKLGTSPKGLAGALWLACTVTGCGGGGGSSSPPPPAALTITTQTPLPRAVTGQPYNNSLLASGGTPPYSWSIVGGTGLPPGLSLNTGGVISGTAMIAGPYRPTFQVRDSNGSVASAGIEIDSVAPITFFVSGALQDGNVGVNYSVALSIQGGQPPYTWSLGAGSNPLPAGLALNSQNGALQGTPTAPGSFNFTVQVSDGGIPPLTAQAAYSLHILNKLVIPQLQMPGGVLNIPYSQPVLVVGGTPPYHWTITGQFPLPSGLSLNSSTGIISGTPTATGPSGFNILVTDSASPAASVNMVMQITIYRPPKFVPTTLPDSAVGQSYFALIFVDGGVPPLSAQVLTGALPDGLSIASANGGFALSGNPKRSGVFQFKLQASDAYAPPNTVTQDFQVRISDPIAISGPTSVQLVEGQSYSTTFSVTGGFPPYVWSGSAPPGFTLDFTTTTATLRGTAGAAGLTESPIIVVDSSSPIHLTGGLLFNMQVFAKLRFLTSVLPAVATGSKVVLTPVIRGGDGIYQWSLAGGSLPPGLSLTANGIIHGTPTAAGSYSPTLTVTSGPANLPQTATWQPALVVKDRGQMTRNDTIAQATPLSNGDIVASISPYSDPSTSGPDVDVYQLTAAPGAQVGLHVTADVHDLPPLNADSLLPVIEIVDGSGMRYQTCTDSTIGFGIAPCVTGLDGNFSGSAGLTFQVPGSGATPVTFYVRILDARGDARPDFIYTLGVFGVN